MIKKEVKSFGNAFKGIGLSLKERHMRFHLLAMILVVGAGFYFQVSVTEWILLLICIGMVIAMEIVNTAIELVVDYINKEQHPMAGKIKDMAAGAVLVVSIISAIVGIIIFYPKLFS